RPRRRPTSRATSARSRRPKDATLRARPARGRARAAGRGALRRSRATASAAKTAPRAWSQAGTRPARRNNSCAALHDKSHRPALGPQRRVLDADQLVVGDLVVERLEVLVLRHAVRADLNPRHRLDALDGDDR